MNVLDWILVGITAVSILYSGWRGFLRDLFSLLGVGVAAGVTVTQWEAAVEFLFRLTGSSILSLLLGIGGLFASCYIVVFLLGRALRGGVVRLGLGWMDRFLGLGFGALKGLLVGALLVMLIGALVGTDHSLIKDSSLAPRLMGMVHELKGLLKKDLNKPNRTQHHLPVRGRASGLDLLV